jgi:hypothetical protein
MHGLAATQSAQHPDTSHRLGGLGVKFTGAGHAQRPRHARSHRPERREIAAVIGQDRRWKTRIRLSAASASSARRVRSELRAPRARSLMLLQSAQRRARRRDNEVGHPQCGGNPCRYRRHDSGSGVPCTARHQDCMQVWATSSTGAFHARSAWSIPFRCTTLGWTLVARSESQCPAARRSEQSSSAYGLYALACSSRTGNRVCLAPLFAVRNAAGRCERDFMAGGGERAAELECVLPQATARIRRHQDALTWRLGARAGAEHGGVPRRNPCAPRLFVLVRHRVHDTHQRTLL